ncbi:MAG: BamA/TamA family outer membrane protein [Pseudomonadota bacterium]
MRRYAPSSRAVLLFCGTAIAAAVTFVPAIAPSQTLTSADTPALVEYGFREGSPIAVPIPFNNPTFGAGLVLGGGYLFQQDEGSGTSFLGGAAFKTDTGSYGGGLGGRLAFDDNRWQLSTFVGGADLTYDVRDGGIQRSVDQTLLGVRAEALYGWDTDVSAGLTLGYLSTEVTPSDPAVSPPFLEGLSDLDLGRIGLVVQWDGLDNDVYPTRGGFARGRVSQTISVSGPSLSYTKVNADVWRYQPLGSRGVLAMKAGACVTGEDAPFFDSCLLSGPDGIRGYGYFDHYGQSLAVAQAEYRYRSAGRLGLAAFFGAGEVFESDQAGDTELNYAGGLGARVTVSKDFGVDLSLDATLNGDGDSLVYLYVGQAF